MKKTMQIKMAAFATVAMTMVACQNDRAERAMIDTQPSPAEPMTMETTNLPTSATQVSDVQRALNREMGTSLTESGQMDAATMDAIRRFQTQERLAVTGSIDGATLQALGLSTGTTTTPPATGTSTVPPSGADRAPASVPEATPAPQQY